MVDSLLDIPILIAGYALATIGAGWVVGWVVPEPGRKPPRLPVRGRMTVPMLIGWFERFLIVTFLLIGDTAAIGFIAIAKTILRFGESRDDRDFAEYVLCGTLVSFSAALLLGLLLKWLLLKC